MDDNYYVVTGQCMHAGFTHVRAGMENEVARSGLHTCIQWRKQYCLLQWKSVLGSNLLVLQSRHTGKRF